MKNSDRSWCYSNIFWSQNKTEINAVEVNCNDKWSKINWLLFLHILYKKEDKFCIKEQNDKLHPFFPITIILI